MSRLSKLRRAWIAELAKHTHTDAPASLLKRYGKTMRYSHIAITSNGRNSDGSVEYSEIYAVFSPAANGVATMPLTLPDMKSLVERAKLGYENKDELAEAIARNLLPQISRAMKDMMSHAGYLENADALIHPPVIPLGGLRLAG